MKKWMFLIAFSVFLIGFHVEKAHAEMPCGSYGLSASAPCVPDGDQMCQEWIYDSNNNVVPGSEQCNTAQPAQGMKTWTNSEGQNCQQLMNPDGSVAQSAQCWWPTKTESAGAGCWQQVYAAGPNAGEPVGDDPTCASNQSAPSEYLKTWVEP